MKEYRILTNEVELCYQTVTYIVNAESEEQARTEVEKGNTEWVDSTTDDYDVFDLPTAKAYVNGEIPFMEIKSIEELPDEKDEHLKKLELLKQEAERQVRNYTLQIKQMK